MGRLSLRKINVDTIWVGNNAPEHGSDIPEEPIAQNHEVVFTVMIDGEANVISTLTVEHNSSISEIPYVALPGYTFLGWYTQENGHGTKLSTYTKIVKDTNYYANWSEGETPASGQEMPRKYEYTLEAGYPVGQCDIRSVTI